MNKDDMLARAQQAASRSGLRHSHERVAARQSNEANTDVWLDLRAIIADPEIQVRVGGLSAPKVESYREALVAGAEFPPVIVCREGDYYYLADGFHRYEAHVRVKKTEIRATIMPGGRSGAIEQAEEGNLRHGLELSMEDKRNIYFRRLARGYWADREQSYRQVAKDFGVSYSTIGRWTREFDTGRVSPNASDEGVSFAPLREEQAKPEKALPRKKTGRKPAQKRAPTALQLKQRALKNLRSAAESFDGLEMAKEAQQVRDFADRLAGDWGLK